MLRQARVIPEARALDLPPEVLENYLYHNANDFSTQRAVRALMRTQSGNA